MAKTAVIIQCDVHCEVYGLPPTYRAWLDDELFAERTWRWPEGQHLEEIWQIRARPGRYQLRYELIGPGILKANNWQVLSGPAGITEQGQLVIHDT